MKLLNNINGGERVDDVYNRLFNDSEERKERLKLLNQIYKHSFQPRLNIDKKLSKKYIIIELNQITNQIYIYLKI